MKDNPSFKKSATSDQRVGQSEAPQTSAFRKNDCGCAGKCGGTPGLNRREFVKLVGLGGGALATAGVTTGGFILSAEKAAAANFSYSLIPADKNLDPAWVASLTARGTPTTYSGAALANIGMPVGGLCAGQIYLAGDGRLWCWDVFNTSVGDLGDSHYTPPLNSGLASYNEVAQGFALQIGSGAGAQYFRLDRTGFAGVTFEGQYPIGQVTYRDPSCPVAVTLEAFTPFIPLNTDDSSTPATVMEFSIHNPTASPVDVAIGGWLENAVCGFTAGVDGLLLNQAVFATDHTRITSRLQPGKNVVVYDNFESGSYAPKGWVAAGTAFGSGPVDTLNYPSSSYQIFSGHQGRYLVNSHASAPGSNGVERDSATGTLTSPTFTLNYASISFLICGGNFPGQECFNLCRASDNAVLLSATGNNSNTFSRVNWDVSQWVGQQVYFQVVDNYTGSWGNIGVDDIRLNLQMPESMVYDDFESGSYAPKGWVTAGTAFGSGPVDTTNYPSSSYQVFSGYQGRYLVNSHASAPGSNNVERDSATGTLTSPTFTLNDAWISFLICGGNFPGKECFNLCRASDNAVLLSATGNNSNTFFQVSWNVSQWVGQQVYFQVVDNYTGSWGNIGVDNIVLGNSPAGGWVAPGDAPDYGTMSLSLLNPQAGDLVSTRATADTLPDLFASLAANQSADATQAVNPGLSLIGALGRTLTLAPGAQATVTFLVAWHFPSTNTVKSGWSTIPDLAGLRKYYATLYADAGAVAAYVAANYSRLSSLTRLWRDTWYDSTLPYWFLDKTFGNISVLATSTCDRFSNGRFWGWEGVYCCQGTCTHVWQYAQAVARIFPDLERDTRQRVDLGLGFDAATGMIGYRAENAMAPAVDGQAGTILRCYREHQMSADQTFLAANYANIKLAMQYLLNTNDPNGDGIMEGAQANTLDAAWYGKISWLSGLYVAACQACQQMALEMGDTTFAAELGGIAQSGADYISANLFYNNQYFIQLPDSLGNDIGAAWGCEIDQLLGESWGYQVHLPPILNPTAVKTGLSWLWTYNFAPDAGGFRLNPANPVQGGRDFADPGESGLVMSTFPDPAHPTPPSGVVASYFNECMTGFEHEVASHMIWTGQLQNGLAVTRAIFDRYNGAKRNPYNEVECGDHYARSMASYGTYIAICGYEYHGPKGYLAFSPKLNPENFRAAFTVAEGWGTFTQQRTGTRQQMTINLVQGRLTLNTFAFDLMPGAITGDLQFMLNGQAVSATTSRNGERITLALASPLVMTAGQALVASIASAAPQITSITPGTNGGQLTWQSVPGTTYTVQYADTLPATWQTLQTGVPASNGTTTVFTDTTASGRAQRFYRILAESQ